MNSVKFMLWLTGTNDLSIRQLQTGVLSLKKSGLDWPPSLPEFRALCGEDSSRVQTFSDTDLIAEDTARKLLAGKLRRDGNRIVSNNGLYVWQREIGGEWVDQPAQRLGRYSVEDVAGV